MVRVMQRKIVVYKAIRSPRGIELIHGIAENARAPGEEEYLLRELAAYIDLFLEEEVRRRRETGGR